MKLIDKAALVAEIDKLKKEIESQDYAAYTEAYIIGVKHTIETISDILDTFEVKEVDLDKEIDNIWSPRFNLGWDENSLLSVNHKGFTTIAKHFFELGLKAQKGEGV